LAVCITNIDRVSADTVKLYQSAEVATVHEAMGRTGLMGPQLRPIYRPAQIAGPAVTCEVAPGDNWMIHVAAEQCQPGVGLIINAGVRDTATLTQMKFPVWSSAIFSQGAVKETLGNVNTPIVCAGALVKPGDLIVADDDGVVIVPKNDATEVYDKVQQRLDNEEAKRKRLASGELGLDIYNMRPRLLEKGFRWIDAKEESEQS